MLEMKEDREMKLLERRRSVLWNGREIPLSRTEFRLLALLWKNRGRIVTYEEMWVKVWRDRAVTDENIRQFISRLRKKLPFLRKWIRTVRGEGYLMDEPTPLRSS